MRTRSLGVKALPMPMRIQPIFFRVRNAGVNSGLASAARLSTRNHVTSNRAASLAEGGVHERVRPGEKLGHGPHRGAAQARHHRRILRLVGWVDERPAIAVEERVDRRGQRCHPPAMGGRELQRSPGSGRCRRLRGHGPSRRNRPGRGRPPSPRTARCARRRGASPTAGRRAPPRRPRTLPASRPD